MSNQSKAQFVEWVKKTHPKLYRAAVVKAGSKNDSGLLAAETPAASGSWLDKIVGTVSQLAPQMIQFRQQKKIMDMQLNRARQNLPPLKVDDYAPVFRVKTDLAPGAQQAVVKTGQELAKPLMFGAIGVVLVMMMTRKRR